MSETRNFDAVALAGTKCVDHPQQGLRVLRQRCAGRLVLESPDYKSPYSNNSCGCALGCGSHIREQNSMRTW
eukprot:7177448-Pyramimonas_sp.AAC.1